MTTVHAGQHLYANVEKEQSPRKQGGFQTLFYTHSAMTEGESEEIEAYLSSDGGAVKWLFFPTSTGKRVVAHIVPLVGPDRHGRRGRYLAHSLVFTPEAFVHLGADPFWVLRHFRFLTTVEEALVRGDFQTGDMPVVALEVPGEPTPDTAVARCWSTQELQKLLLLALRAEQMAGDHKAVAFVGEPQQVRNALETVFFAVPTLLRQHCTFDTDFGLKKRNFGATYCWAIGEPEPPSDFRFTLVDTQSHQVLGAITGQPETAYERWVLEALARNDLEAIASLRDEAFTLCAWLEGHADGVSLGAAMPPEVVVSVFRVNAPQVREMLRNRLGKQVSPILVPRIFEPIYRHTEPVELFRQLRQGFELFQLLQMLYQVYETLGCRAPQREEIRALGAILQHTEHRDLHLLHACWTNRRKELREGLERLSEDDYSHFVHTALRCGIGEPLAFLIPGRGEAFLELYLASNAIRDQDLVAVVWAVLEAGEVSHLPRLIPYIPEQSARKLRTIAKTLSRRADIPESFRCAVSDAITALPPEKGLRDLLRALLESRRGRREENDGTSC